MILLLIEPPFFPLSSRESNYSDDDTSKSSTHSEYDDSEYLYNMELQLSQLKVSLTESVSDGIKQSLRDKPFMVRSPHVYNGDMEYVGSSIVLNLRDRTIRGGLFRGLYVGLCHSNSSNARIQQLQFIFGSELMTHTPERYDFFEFVSNIEVPFFTPTAIMSSILSPYLSRHF